MGHPQIILPTNNYSAQHSTPTMKSMIALLVVLVLAVCQIDAYPQPIFFPGGSGAGFGGGNAGLFGASSYGGGISNAYNGGLSTGYGNGFDLLVLSDSTPVEMETVSPMANKCSFES